MDGLRNIYIDMSYDDNPIKRDDFLIAIGKKKSNSVYHVYSVVLKPKASKIRYHLEVVKCELIDALRREPPQKIQPFYWYSR